MDIQVGQIDLALFPNKAGLDYYKIILTELEFSYILDEVNYDVPAFSAIFLSPHQHFELIGKVNTPSSVTQIMFNGDYYCIELHKHDVACNGLLFNAVYQLPHVLLHKDVFVELLAICGKMMSLGTDAGKFRAAIMKSYLQLILALTSDQKQNYIDQHTYFSQLTTADGVIFQDLVEQYYRTEKTIAFYADSMHMTAEALSKTVKKSLRKSPSKIIQERTILEAKKLLHLTYKSVKEIAQELCFHDQFYFSRYFKNIVGLSPQKYRQAVGISAAANLSKQ